MKEIKEKDSLCGISIKVLKEYFYNSDSLQSFLSFFEEDELDDAERIILTAWYGDEQSDEYLEEKPLVSIISETLREAESEMSEGFQSRALVKIGFARWLLYATEGDLKKTVSKEREYFHYCKLYV